MKKWKLIVEELEEEIFLFTAGHLLQNEPLHNLRDVTPFFLQHVVSWLMFLYITRRSRTTRNFQLIPFRRKENGSSVAYSLLSRL